MNPAQARMLFQRKGVGAQGRAFSYNIVRDLERAKPAPPHQKAASEENGAKPVAHQISREPMPANSP